MASSQSFPQDDLETIDQYGCLGYLGAWSWDTMKEKWERSSRSSRIATQEGLGGGNLIGKW